MAIRGFNYLFLQHFVHLFINFLYCIRCKRIFRALCLMGFSIGLELILCLTTEVRSKSMFRGSKQVLILKQEFFSLHSLCMRQIFFMVEEFEILLQLFLADFLRSNRRLCQQSHLVYLLGKVCSIYQTYRLRLTAFNQCPTYDSTSLLNKFLFFSTTCI